MSRRIAITLQKGGVGKTTVTVNLAAALAASLDLRTVVVDMDAQCNATAHLLGDDVAGPTLSEVLRGEATPAEALVRCHHEKLRVLPGAPDLSAWERGADDPRRAGTILGVRDLLDGGLPDDVDVALIDTPPGGGLWLQAALAAAHGFVIVAWPDGFSATGILQLLRTVDHVRERYNPDLALDGMVINHVRPTRGHQAYAAAFREIYGDAVLRPELPVRSVVSDARDAAMPVEAYERTYRPSSRAAGSFRALAAGLARRAGLVPPALTAAWEGEADGEPAELVEA